MKLEDIAKVLEIFTEKLKHGEYGVLEINTDSILFKKYNNEYEANRLFSNSFGNIALMMFTETELLKLK